MQLLCGNFRISKTFLQKSEIIKEILITDGNLMRIISDGVFITNLKRRITQMQEGANKLILQKANELNSVICFNNSNLTWEEVFDKRLDFETSTTKLKPNSAQNLRK